MPHADKEPAHSHAHHHVDAHPHNHPPENYATRKHPEFVVLDIGDDVGALIVHTDREMHRVEVEISPAHDDQCRSHKEVLERSINGRPAFTAVFDGLRTGTYTLWTNGEARTRGVTIEGSAIAELDLKTRVTREPGDVRP
jgi:hypothetical protein